MRLPVPLLLLALGAGCGQKVDHPDAAADCDPATMDCSLYRPPKGGSVGGGSEGEAGAPSASPTGATVAGQVIVYSDDYFDSGLAFAGEADVSAVTVGGARVTDRYAGAAFELTDVLKDSANWFMVEPEQGQGMLTTVTPVDTRAAKADGYAIGLVNDLTVDSLFVQLGTERSTLRAQIVVTVVDELGRSVPDVHAAITAEVTAYRQTGGWVAGDAGTDDSGMIFLGNVPASAALAQTTIVFSGAASARVDVQARAGAVSVVTAVVSPP